MRRLDPDRLPRLIRLEPPGVPGPVFVLLEHVGQLLLARVDDKPLIYWSAWRLAAPVNLYAAAAWAVEAIVDDENAWLEHRVRMNGVSQRDRALRTAVSRAAYELRVHPGAGAAERDAEAIDKPAPVAAPEPERRKPDAAEAADVAALLRF